MSWFKAAFLALSCLPTPEDNSLSVGEGTNPYAKPVNAFAATDGSLHPTREAALDVSRRAAYRDAYVNATKELKTVAHLGGPFDRYQNGNGEWSRDLVIHQILTHKDRVIRILQSIPKEPAQ